MHITSLIAAVAFTAVPALAAPSAEFSLLERGNYPVCKPSEYYRGWDKGCHCEKGMKWNKYANKCTYPMHPKPTCQYGERAYCAKSKSEYGAYGEKEEKCYDNGKNVAFCCKEKDLYKKLEKECPPKKENCGYGKHWSYKTSSCECEKGKYDYQGKCDYRPMPKPYCKKEEKPYCARDKVSYKPYESSHSYCKEDGHNIAFCCEPPKVKKECEKKWDY